MDGAKTTLACFPFDILLNWRRATAIYTTFTTVDLSLLIKSEFFTGKERSRLRVVLKWKKSEFPRCPGRVWCCWRTTSNSLVEKHYRDVSSSLSLHRDLYTAFDPPSAKLKSYRSA